MKKYLDLADKSEYYYLKDNAIVTKLPEIGYMEELHDEDWYEKSYIWFYGEWLGSEEANVESNLKTMAMRIRDLLKESNHAQWKEVDDFLKQYEHMHVCDEKLIRRMVCKCYIEELEVKKTEGEKLLNDLVGAELPDGTHSEEFPAIKQRYFDIAKEFSKMLKTVINCQLEELLCKSN